jgi:hypothetical protein
LTSSISCFASWVTPTGSFTAGKNMLLATVPLQAHNITIGLDTPNDALRKTMRSVAQWDQKK